MATSIYTSSLRRLLGKFRTASRSRGASPGEAPSDNQGMSSPKAAAFIALMFALGAAQDRTSQAALKDLPLPWVVATLHFGAGMLWIFPAWTIGLRQTPSLNDNQKKRVAPLAFLHAAGHLCSLGVLGAGSLAMTHVFQAAEPILVSLMSSFMLGNAQHLVAWLALLPLVAGVAITFREGLGGSWMGKAIAIGGAMTCGARTIFSHQVIKDEAVALKGQICSVVFVSGCLVLLPFAIIMEGSEVVPQWERTVEAVGNTALIIKLVRGGTLFYMWSECLFGLVEEAGALAAAVTVAVRPVAVYAFSSTVLGGGWSTGGGVGTALTAMGACLFALARRKYMLKPRRTRQQ